MIKITAEAINDAERIARQIRVTPFCKVVIADGIACNAEQDDDAAKCCNGHDWKVS